MDGTLIKQTDASPPLFWGIDIGGTQIKIGLVDSMGGTVFQTSIPTAEKGPEAALKRVTTVIVHDCENRLPDTHRAKAIGIGAPGPMNLVDGTLIEPPQLPSWENFAIVDRMQALTERPVSFQNDANAAAYGEFWLGSGKSDQSMLFLTLGTGVGGGIVTEGDLVNGTNSFAGEVGHMMVKTLLQTPASAFGAADEGIWKLMGLPAAPSRQLRRSVYERGTKVTSKSVYPVRTVWYQRNRSTLPQ